PAAAIAVTANIKSIFFIFSFPFSRTFALYQVRRVNLIFIQCAVRVMSRGIYEDTMPKPRQTRKQLPKSFKDLAPAKHFNPRTFFHEMVWKTLLTRRTGQHRKPTFPKLQHGQVAITWIGHASFLLQFTDLNVLVDPNFANWLFLLKRIKRSGLKIKDLPPIDLVLLTHAHFDHFHKPTLRRLPP